MAAPSHTPTESRGEINELRQSLRDPQLEKDSVSKRDVLRKVIALMTVGVDTSSLFTEMILACFTTDIVSKKLIYFYLISRSENNAELALLSINTLTKECADNSPLVRGLALRSLASLRLPQLFDFLIPAVQKGFTDTSPYVRKTACACALKVYRISPGEFRKQQFFGRMLGMLRDGDALVASNALAVLLEVSRDEEASGLSEESFVVTKPILYHLLNKMRAIPEWHQAQVINLVLRYTPEKEEEMFDIMNLLEERLQTQNSDVVLSVCNAFFHLTQNYPSVHGQVFDRLKHPLLSLVSSSTNVEVSYVVLCHIKLLAEREPRVFQESYKLLYCHYMEPTYVKLVKIDILSKIVTEMSASGILEEFAAYAHERNNSLTSAAVAAMGRMALRLPSTAKAVLLHFLYFLEQESDPHLCKKCLGVMKDFLRKYRDIEIVRPFLDTLVKVYHAMNLTDDESKIAFIWVLGELGEHIEDAPYILEGLCDGLLSESPEFRLQLLTSAVTLFFKRPPEMQPVLGQIFALLVNDFSHADVHDQALLYYRLLRYNLSAAMKVICSPKKEIQEFVEDQNSEMRDKLFEEFNTLSVVYYQPSEKFMSSPAAAAAGDDDDEEEEAEEEEVEDVGIGHNVNREESVAAPPSTSWGPIDHNFELSEDVSLEPSEFQQRWVSFESVATLQLLLNSAFNPDTFEEGLEDCGVITLASGDHETSRKYYLYAQEEGDTSTYFLIELIIHNTGIVNATIKSDNVHTTQFVELFKRIMSQF